MDARAILIVATGADKRRTFERALRSLDSQTAPVSALLRQADVPIRFFWSP
jgi:6-phosphogluconolactonase/glucosamine-6-phosphate isomerase/deaminase